MLDEGKDDSQYSQTHSQFHPWFREFARERGYFDIFIFDLEGNLVYSVFKKSDYATNFEDGEFKDTDLGNAFRAAAEAEKPGSLSFFDFKPYAPGNNAPASFISAPVTDTSGQIIGVLAFKMPVDRINKILGQTKGLGESGESILVGKDMLVRNDTRHFSDSILKRKVDHEGVQRALGGETDIVVYEAPNGIVKEAAFAPLDFQGQRFALVTQLDYDEANAPVIELRNYMLMLGAAALVLIGLVGYMVSKTMARPILLMTQAMTRLASGEEDTEIPAKGRRDEIGQMADAVESFKESVTIAQNLAREQAEIERQQAAEREKVAAEKAKIDAELAKKSAEESPCCIRTGGVSGTDHGRVRRYGEQCPRDLCIRG